MAKFLFCPMLSIILTLAGSLVLNENFAQGYQIDTEVSSDAGDTSKNHADVNTLHQDEDCYYPHRCNKRHYCGEPLYCDYWVHFGQRNERDKRIWRRIYRKPLKSQSLVIHVQYPKANATNDLPIGYIRVENKEKTMAIHNDEISVVEGGIGQKFVKFNIASRDPEAIKYRVIIYAK